MQIILIIIFAPITLMIQLNIKEVELIMLILLILIQIHIIIIKKARIIMMTNHTNKIKFRKNNKKT